MIESSKDEATTIKNLGNLKAVIQREKNIKRRWNEDVLHKTIGVPDWLPPAIDIVKRVYKTLKYKDVYCAMTLLGGVIFIDKYSEMAKKFDDLKFKLLYSDNEVISSLVAHLGHKISVDNLVNTRLSHMDIPLWVYESLNGISISLSVKPASLYRATLYFSLDSAKEILPPKINKHIKEAKAAYDYYIVQNLGLMEDLLTAQEIRTSKS